MADEKKLNELTEEELDNAAGGYVVAARNKFGYVECATVGCKNRFISKNGETLCEKCRAKSGKSGKSLI